MMFLWAAERLKLSLQSYECRCEGTKLIELDQTETFTELRLAPVIALAAEGEDPLEVEKRTAGRFGRRASTVWWPTR